VDIFAEVVPEDKYNIVDTLQKGGHIVAMTGVDVNIDNAAKVWAYRLLRHRNGGRPTRSGNVAGH